MSKVVLLPKKAFRVKGGHPWVYSNEVKFVEGTYVNGDIVEVWDSYNKFIGKGYINDKSQIMVRLLTNNKLEVIDEAFIYKKINEAWQYRKELGYDKNARVFYSEADGLPGLIIDKFGEILVIQTLSLGIEKWKGVIVNILEKIFSPAGVYERNDATVRTLEGLPLQTGFLTKPFKTKFEINNDGIKIVVDIANGQKTGFFHDQRKNRLAIQRIAKNASVLDAFCYTGSFSMYAAKFGASQVLGLDISPEAIAICEENASLNGFGQCSFETANVFDKLKQYVTEKKQWDVVMLDPPAFTKTRANFEKALKGYKEVNLRGIQLTKPGGYLVTSSCSHYIYPEEFKTVITEAAMDAGRQLRLVTFNGASPDHPNIWNIKETNYLKFAILQVL
jgi:23S rRNA (cytosine1962-C5)-methyltransferase